MNEEDCCLCNKIYFKMVTTQPKNQPKKQNVKYWFERQKHFFKFTKEAQGSS
jgi:hypothetical protein